MSKTQYTWKEFKTDALTGALNGLLFSFVYSFYTQPFEFKKEEVVQKYSNRPLLYYRSWAWRISLAFAILRTTNNAISKYKLGTAYEVGGMVLSVALVSKFLL